VPGSVPGGAAEDAAVSAFSGEEQGMGDRRQDDAGFTVTLRVKPGASRDRVGGRYGADDPAILIVAVQARAVEGAANRAVLDLVARAFGVRVARVALVSGERSRTKVLRLTGDAAVFEGRWGQLLNAP
jgi:uncharacterized protein (TIGR00251 family)